MLSPDQGMASRFFNTHGTHVNHCRSHNQSYQHQQFEWTFCPVDFCWTFLIQLSLSKLILKTENTVTKLYHTAFEWMKYSNQMFYQKKIRKSSEQFFDSIETFYSAIYQSYTLNVWFVI